MVIIYREGKNINKVPAGRDKNGKPRWKYYKKIHYVSANGDNHDKQARCYKKKNNGALINYKKAQRADSYEEAKRMATTKKK